MVDRTRSNPNWDKIPTKLGPKNSSDRQKDYTFLIKSIKTLADRIQEEKSSKSPDEERIAKWQKQIKDCRQTIHKQRLDIASLSLILSEIEKDLDNNNYDAALKTAAKIKDVPAETFFTAALAKKQRG